MTGIKRDRYGFRAYIKVGDQQREKRFPPNTPTKAMQDWRGDTAAELRKLREPGAPAGSLQDAITRYLGLVASMPTIEQRRQHLKLWTDALGAHVQRRAITSEQIRTVLQTWRQTYGPATCNKRRSALMHLWSVLDGRGASNPVRNVPKFKVSDPVPRGRDPHDIDAALKRRQSSRMRACCRVMLWTGMRPAELQRAQPDDLGEHAIVVRTAKGGRVRVVPLTPQAIAAWKEFDVLECWGHVPTAAPMNRWLKHVTQKDIRVYDLRHSYGTALARQGTRLDVIGSLMGHSTLELTRVYTLAAVSPDALTATQRLGRRTASGTASRQRQKAAESGGRIRRKTKKTA